MHNYNAPDYTREALNTNTETGYANESATDEYESYPQFEDERAEEYETDSEMTFNEAAQSELAGEMPSAENEAEMDHFMQRLLQRAVGRKRMASDSNLSRTLRKLLRGLAVRLFDKRKSSGHRLSHSVGEVNNSLQSEVFGNENEFESRKAFIRMAGNTVRRAFGMRGNYSPGYRVRHAMKGAAQRYLPALLRLRKYHRHSKHLAARLGSLEQALMQLADKISSIQPGENSGIPPLQSPSQNAPVESADTEYETIYNEDYESNESEWENEYESEENEYESEDNEFEEGEYEENEAEENEYESEKGASCGCAKCRTATATKNEYEENEFEFEDNEYEENEYEGEDGEHEYEQQEENEYEYEEQEWEAGNEREITFNESEQMELASELLAVQSEYELDQFLGKLIKKAGRALKKVTKIAIPGPLAGMLKKVAKAALPIAGGVLGGTFIPGAGNILGKKLGSAAADLFELELEGLSAEDQEFEKARAFVRFAGNAVNRSALVRKKYTPVKRARIAFRHAARQHAPGLLRRRQQQRAMRQRALRRNRVQPNRRYPGRKHSTPPLRHVAHRPYPGTGYAQGFDQLSNYPDYTGGDTGLLNSKMQSIENMIHQLNERVESLNPGNNASGYEETNQGPGPAVNSSNGAENEYWN